MSTVPHYLATREMGGGTVICGQGPVPDGKVGCLCIWQPRALPLRSPSPPSCLLECSPLHGSVSGGHKLYVGCSPRPCPEPPSCSPMRAAEAGPVGGAPSGYHTPEPPGRARCSGRMWEGMGHLQGLQPWVRVDISLWLN